MSYLNPNSSTVAIVGGDPLVGHALELMLQSAGYGARFSKGVPTNGEANFLDGTNLVLIAPRSNEVERSTILSRLHKNGGTTPSKTQVPVVELVATADGAQHGIRRVGEEEVARHVLWPCQAKDLMREIEAALLNDSS